MNQNIEFKQDKEEESKNKPNEDAGLHFSTHLKIFDPNSKEIIVKTRGD